MDESPWRFESSHPHSQSGWKRTTLRSRATTRAIETAARFARTPTFKAHLAQTHRERVRDGGAIKMPVTVARRARASRMWDDPGLVARTILEGSKVRARTPTSV